MIKYLRPSMLCLLLSVFAIEGCDDDAKQVEDTRRDFVKPLDPYTQIDELSKALLIKGTNIAGNAPESSTASNISIGSYSQSASVSNDNILFIPFTYSAVAEIIGAYLQLDDADNYWEIPVQAEDNTHVLEVGIPLNVLNGDFTLSYKLFDQSGNVSEARSMKIAVEPSIQECRNGSYGRVEGSDNITVKTYKLNGDKPAKVSITYYMYTVPDRIDIRYNNKWVYSSGALLSDTDSKPPIKQCSRVVSGDGFTGGGTTFTLDFDPAISRKLDVYVSGCLDGGTAWYFDVSCPGSNVQTAKWYDDLPACPCNFDDKKDGQKESAPDGAGGKWVKCGSASKSFHYGSTYEMRWAPDKKNDPGQQCNYNKDKQLITGGIAAGSPDLISPGSCGNSLTEIGAGFDLICENFAHCEKDVLPWRRIPCKDYLAGWPANNPGNCGKDAVPVTRIEHIAALVGNMTCEQVTILYQLVDASTVIGLQNFMNQVKGTPTPSNQQLNDWLTELKKSCGSNCAVVEKALLNLKSLKK